MDSKHYRRTSGSADCQIGNEKIASINSNNQIYIDKVII